MASKSNAETQPAKDDGKDIRGILTTDERAELTLLVANIAEIMAKQIRDTFDASVTSPSKPHHILQSGDKNPNKSTNVPHKETDEEETTRKLLERREKELSEPQMLKLKDEALKFFEKWREAVISRVGEAVNNPKEVVEEQKQSASVDKTPDTAAPPEPQVIRKHYCVLRRLRNQVRILTFLHSAQYEHRRGRRCIDPAVSAYVYPALLSPQGQENPIASLYVIISSFSRELCPLLSSSASPYLILIASAASYLGRKRGQACPGSSRSGKADERRRRDREEKR